MYYCCINFNHGLIIFKGTVYGIRCGYSLSGHTLIGGDVFPYNLVNKNSHVNFISHRTVFKINRVLHEHIESLDKILINYL